jgi:dUTP pyrophosphatase
MLHIQIQRLDPGLPYPRYAKPGDAGLDLYSTEDRTLRAAGGRLAIPTGLAIAIPEGYVGLILSRSGLATDHGVVVLNSPGVVDSGFRGEIVALMVNHDPQSDYLIQRGDRICQLVVAPIPAQVQLESVTCWQSTDRGTGGFGHTGR